MARRITVSHSHPKYMRFIDERMNTLNQGNNPSSRSALRATFPQFFECTSADQVSRELSKRGYSLSPVRVREIAKGITDKDSEGTFTHHQTMYSEYIIMYTDEIDGYMM